MSTLVSLIYASDCLALSEMPLHLKSLLQLLIFLLPHTLLHHYSLDLQFHLLLLLFLYLVKV